MKVDFIIGGVQKCGTTALATFLRKHEQICFAGPKEVHFFDYDDLFQQDPPPYDRYHGVFSPNASTRVCGEATPIYLYWNPSIPRIKTYNPDIKWIILLRNPVDRAYSHYAMEQGRDMEHLSFSEAIRAEKQRLAEIHPKQHRVHSYIDRGFYSRQIKRLLHEFPREQCLFLKNEDLLERHQETLSEVFHFLGVDPTDQIASEMVFKRSYPDMNPEDRLYLQNIFNPEIGELESLLGWDCSSWR